MKCSMVLIVAALTIGVAESARSSEAEDAFDVSQAALGAPIPDLSFTDTRNQPVRLSDFQGKPLVITLVYTGCADVCPAIIESLYPAVREAQQALGEDSFSVITVGFDTRNDSAVRMRSFARQHGVDLPNWTFLAGTSDAVDRLASAVGFTIIPSAGGFDHMAQVTFVDKAGNIYQHLYGGSFSTPAVVEPLKDLVFDRQKPVLSLAGIAERIKWFCTIYNPNTGRYYFNYSLFIGIAIGLACLLLVLSWLLREIFRTGGPGQGVA